MTGEDLNRDIRARGLPAEAVVVEIWDTGTRINDDPVVGFHLELHAEGRQPWQAESRALVSILDLPRIQPGSVVAGLDALDLTGTPADFVWAFARHRDAWDDAIPFFEPYQALRGEMHTLFDEIRQSDEEAGRELEAIEEEIWGTWHEVERAASQLPPS